MNFKEAPGKFPQNTTNSGNFHQEIAGSLLVDIHRHRGAFLADYPRQTESQRESCPPPEKG